MESGTDIPSTVSASCTFSESERESGGLVAGRLSVSTVSPAANRVSAAARVRIGLGSEGRLRTLAWSRAGKPGEPAPVPPAGSVRQGGQPTVRAPSDLAGAARDT